MTGERGLAKAVALGGFAAGAVFCFCLTLAGAAWFFVALCYLEDHRGSRPGVDPAAAVFGLLLVVSCLIASRFGWRVGRDWYRNGR